MTGPTLREAWTTPRPAPRNPFLDLDLSAMAAPFEEFRRQVLATWAPMFLDLERMAAAVERANSPAAVRARRLERRRQRRRVRAWERRERRGTNVPRMGGARCAFVILDEVPEACWTDRRGDCWVDHGVSEC